MLKSKNIPLTITFIVGIIMIVSFFIPHRPFGDIEQISLKWYSIIAGFTMLLGVDSLVGLHYRKIKRKEENWQHSIVLIAGFLMVVIAGIVGTVQFGSAFDEKSFFTYIYNYFIVPLQSTMFSLLAFFVASAAYRAFRARNVDAALLLITAVIVMLGRVPVGEVISPYLPKFTDWIMEVPQMAAKRGIGLGIYLGALGVSIRIILGIERSYLS
ncbi:MAG: hypothetical protein PHW02_07170 [bacterium]|nr:hypothetical protein [bacterium]